MTFIWSDKDLNDREVVELDPADLEGDLGQPTDYSSPLEYFGALALAGEADYWEEDEQGAGVIHVFLVGAEERATWPELRRQQAVKVLEVGDGGFREPRWRYAD